MTSAISRTSKLRAAAVLGAALMVASATNAFAATTDEAAPTVRVGYHDLNLSSDQGTAALYGRIVSAAKMVCQVSDIRDLRAVAAAKECRAQAIARAVQEVGNPRLAAVYAAHQDHG